MKAFVLTSLLLLLLATRAEAMISCQVGGTKLPFDMSQPALGAPDLVITSVAGQTAPEGLLGFVVKATVSKATQDPNPMLTVVISKNGVESTNSVVVPNSASNPISILESNLSSPDAQIGVRCFLS